jgi:hypothetical protein
MSLHRVVLVAVATLFSIGMTSIASAGCCGWGYSAPVAYAAPVGYGGYGGYGGCGGCGAPTVAAVYAAPVAPAVPAPIAVAPVMPTAFGGPCCGWNGCGNCGLTDWSGGQGWGSGCGNCGGCGACGQAAVYAAPSLYVVNQGPVYSGPGIMIPYQTYSPETAYVPATDYPYVPGSGYYGYGSGLSYPPYYAHPYAHPYYRPRYAYRAPMAMHPYARPYMHPRYYGAPRWRHYP